MLINLVVVVRRLLKLEQGLLVVRVNYRLASALDSLLLILDYFLFDFGQLDVGLVCVNARLVNFIGNGLSDHHLEIGDAGFVS